MIWPWLLLVVQSTTFPFLLRPMSWVYNLLQWKICKPFKAPLLQENQQTHITSSQEPPQTEFSQLALMEAFSIIAGRLRQALSTIKKEIPSRNSHFLLQAFVSQAGKSINPENKKEKH